MPDGSIKPELSLSDYRGSYVVLLCYPLDFTFVCPSELIAHNNRLAKFAELGIQLLGLSVDSQFTHLAWRETPVQREGSDGSAFLSSPM
jgi:peroxiredoxin 2/4